MVSRFEEFVTLIDQIYLGIRKVKISEMQSMDLKGAHVMCLYELHRNPDGLTSSKLSSLCDIDKAAVSRTIADLEQRGLVSVAGETGKRRYRAPVRLTETGMEAALKMEARIEEIVETVSGSFSDEERLFFYGALREVASHLRDESGLRSGKST